MKKILSGILVFGAVLGSLIVLKADQKTIEPLIIKNVKGISEPVVYDDYLMFWRIQDFRVAEEFERMVTAEINALVNKEGFSRAFLNWYYGREQKSKRPVIVLWKDCVVTLGRWAKTLEGISVGYYAEDLFKLYATTRSTLQLKLEAKKVAKEFFDAIKDYLPKIKRRKTFKVPGFPEKITTEITTTPHPPLVVIENCFVVLVLKRLKQPDCPVFNRKIGYGYFQGKKTERLIVAFFVDENNGKIFICAYYYDELFKCIKDKYPGTFSTKQAVEVLRAKINDAAAIIISFLKKRRSDSK